MNRRLPILSALALTAIASFGLAPSPALAATEFPDKPVRLIVPFAAGGGVDNIARVSLIETRLAVTFRTA